MPQTPDRKPGVSDEEGQIFSDEGVLATQEGEMRYHDDGSGGRFSFFDEQGEYDPRSGLPTPTRPGELLIAVGGAFEVRRPLLNCAGGWLCNGYGLMVEGE